MCISIHIHIHPVKEEWERPERRPRFCYRTKQKCAVNRGFWRRKFAPSILVFAWDVFQNVTGLAVQSGADGLQGGEAHRLGLVVFQNGQVGKGDVHFFGQLTEGHLPLRHHHIQIDYDHTITSNRQVVLFLHDRGLTEQTGHEQE